MATDKSITLEIRHASSLLAGLSLLESAPHSCRQPRFSLVLGRSGRCHQSRFNEYTPWPEWSPRVQPV